MFHWAFRSVAERLKVFLYVSERLRRFQKGFRGLNRLSEELHEGFIKVLETFQSLSICFRALQEVSGEFRLAVSETCG